MDRLLFLLLTTSILGTPATLASVLDSPTSHEQNVMSPFKTPEDFVRLVTGKFWESDIKFLSQLGYNPTSYTLDLLLNAFFDLRVISEDNARDQKFIEIFCESPDESSELLLNVASFWQKPNNLALMIRKLMLKAPEFAFNLFQRFVWNPAIKETDRLNSAIIFMAPEYSDYKRDYALGVATDIISKTTNFEILDELIDLFNEKKDKKNLRLACLRFSELSKGKSLCWMGNLLEEHGFPKDAISLYIETLKCSDLHEWEYSRAVKDCLKAIMANPELGEERESFKQLLWTHHTTKPQTYESTQLYIDTFITLGYIEEAISASNLDQTARGQEASAKKLATVNHPQAQEAALALYLKTLETVSNSYTLSKLAEKITALHLSDAQKAAGLVQLYTLHKGLIQTDRDSETFGDIFAAVKHPQAHELSLALYLEASETFKYFHELHNLAKKIAALLVSDEQKAEGLRKLYTSREDLIKTLKDTDIAAQQLVSFGLKSEADALCREYLESRNPARIRLEQILSEINRLYPYFTTPHAFLRSLFNQILPSYQNNEFSQLLLVDQFITLGDYETARQIILGIIPRTSMSLEDALTKLSPIFTTDEQIASLVEIIARNPRYRPS